MLRAVCMLIVTIVSSPAPSARMVAGDMGPLIPRGAHIVGFGDSITSGPGWFDQFVAHYPGAVGIDLALPGTCLERTAPGTHCSGSGSGYSRYKTALRPYVGVDTWFVILYGTNDAFFSDGVDAKSFRSQYKAIIDWLEKPPQRVRPNHIIVGTIPPLVEPTHLRLVKALNLQIAYVARDTKVRFADTFDALEACWPKLPPETDACSDDGVHPNDTPDGGGHFLIAKAFESATRRAAASFIAGHR